MPASMKRWAEFSGELTLSLHDEAHCPCASLSAIPGYIWEPVFAHLLVPANVQ